MMKSKSWPRLDPAPRPIRNNEGARSHVETALVDRRGLTLVCWVEVAEFDAGVVGGELPVDLTLGGVGGVLPGVEFGVEDVEVLKTTVQALAGQR